MFAPASEFDILLSIRNSSFHKMHSLMMSFKNSSFSINGILLEIVHGSFINEIGFGVVEQLF